MPDARDDNLHRNADDSIKATIESVFIALILAFIFRAYVVEAFVIPTGSMAPTLLGTHLCIDDRQTGYRFTVNPPQRRGENDPVAITPYVQTIISPMSGAEIDVPAGTPTYSGDRILVHKYIYAISSPRRWDVVVFKAPQEPQTNYIKRLIGLPNEQIHFLDGNVFASTDDGKTFHIARKTDPAENRHWQTIQRAVFQPVYHSQFTPLDPVAAGIAGWSTPWVANDTPDSAGAWEIEGRRSYVYAPQAETAGDAGNKASGGIHFDFKGLGPDPWKWEYPYNQLMGGNVGSPPPIEDIRLAAGVQPQAENLTVEFSTTARLGDPKQSFEHLVARVDADGHVSLLARPVNPADAGEARLLAEAQVAPLPRNRTTQIELWYVDQEAIIFVAGDVALRHRFDMTLKQMEHLPGPLQFPHVGIRLSAAATLHEVELDRDLYYISEPTNGRSPRGGIYRLNDGGRHTEPAADLHADEFFVCGDNSPKSSDSRLWEWNPEPLYVTNSRTYVRALNPNREINAAFFPDDGRDHAGIVPRDLMIGRAFFVYFPAWKRLGPFRYVPNFGDMRFIW